MGVTANKKMLPMILLRVLWEHADANHGITMEQICYYVSEYFEASYQTDRGLEKLISKNIKQLNDFFEETNWCMKENEPMEIVCESAPNLLKERGYIKKYYIKGRLFSDTELRLLCDGVLFSKGIAGKQAGGMIKKLKKLSSKYFGKTFELIRYTDVVKRTNNEMLFRILHILGNAILKKRKVSFLYKRTKRSEGKKAVVSPYFLVISAGHYYLLCNYEGKEDIARYRIDRMEEIVILEQEVIKKLELLNSIPQPFQLFEYMEEHPRMSFEKPVDVTLLVEAQMLDAVEEEFHLVRAPEMKDGKYMVRIRSSKSSICNWIINVTEYIKIEYVSDKSVIELLLNRANQVIDTYDIKNFRYPCKCLKNETFISL